MFKIQKEIIRFIQAGFLGLLVLSGFINEAQAVPSFARQTGENCVACHTSFPELTPFGREFKLNGYTLGEAQWLPFSGMATVSSTSLKSSKVDGVKVMPKDGSIELDTVAVFLAGKINDHMGGFIQGTYTNHMDNGAGGTTHHSNIDNTDIRIVNEYTLFGKNVLVGLTLNNNPTVQDVWNSTPAWGFPFNSSIATGLPGPTAGLAIDGGYAQAVAGLGAYMWWDRHLYAELSMYGNANRTLGFLSAGSRLDPTNSLTGHNNPYWRLAWNEEWGANSLMVGTYGMRFDINNAGVPVNKYTDTAVDAQYQYISDPSIFTAQATFIHENQSVSNNNLNLFKGKLSYLYNRTYGASLGFVNTTGSTDTAYSSSLDPSSPSSPNNRYFIGELDYNYNPQVRFLMQYTAYSKLDQAALTVTGSARSASDNNTLWLATWFAF
jgi:hypothetical protein